MGRQEAVPVTAWLTIKFSGHLTLEKEIW